MSQDVMKQLIRYFKNKRIVVAFSGGLDSAVLLEVANKSASAVLPVLVKSTLQSASEVKSALEYLSKRRKKYEVLGINPLKHPEISENNPERCYFCKKLIFQTIINGTKKFKPDIIVEGTNRTEFDEYKPGIGALKELKIKSPFLELNITKEQILEIAEKMKIETSDRPSTTCLATRIPYGKSINKEKIMRIELAEDIIKKTFPVDIVRVRDHDEIARIEVSKDDAHFFINHEKTIELIEKLKELGFNHIVLDLEGYQQDPIVIPIPRPVKREKSSKLLSR